MRTRLAGVFAIPMVSFVLGARSPTIAEAPPAEVKRTVEVRTITFVPPLVRGDGEFKGHGPRVHVWAKLLEVRNGQLWVRVYMKAEETREDWTTLEGEQDYVLYDEKEVVGIAPGQDMASAWDYVDNNEEDDESPTLPEGELVKKWICVGDTQGEDVGVSRVTVHFRPIKLIVKE